MLTLRNAPGSWLRRASVFEPRSTALAVGRSLLAAGELTVLLFTGHHGLFPHVPNEPVGPRCSGFGSVSLWCLGDSSDLWLAASGAISVTVLLAVACGYRPRWTCVPHWYVTFSLGVSIPLPNGGEQAGRVATLLLIPVCLGDDRAWQWIRPQAPLRPTWRGASYAGQLAIRGQVAIIYGQAVWTKLREASWRNGTAMYYIFQDAYFGAADGVMAVMRAPLFHYWLVPTITWAVIVVELLVAVSVFGNTTVRRCGLAVGVVLHTSIAAILGLVSFGVIMIGLLAVSTGPTATQRGASWAPRSPPQDPRDTPRTRGPDTRRST